MAAAAGGVAATAVDGKPMNDPVCASLDEVRENIDRLDCALVPLLVERVVAHVRALASQAGGNPDFIETLYRAMIATYIADELRLWETRRG